MYMSQYENQNDNGRMYVTLGFKRGRDLRGMPKYFKFSAH